MAVLTVVAIGALAMWSMPLAWMWVGARVYDATGSVGADLGVAFLGFAASAWLVMVALARIDVGWVALRRRAGHDQVQGALTRVVVVQFTFGILLFLVWWYIIDQAFVMPFMPTQ